MTIGSKGSSERTYMGRLEIIGLKVLERTRHYSSRALTGAHRLSVQSCSRALDVMKLFAASGVLSGDIS